ncbi:MAG: PfkB family carbohydrate kinase, partial [Gemmataceae bacterium]|nr:PfkB family carbohydrate kinase [Gemmataceae bacterium]
LNRLDIKNRSVTSVALQEQLVGRLQHYWPTLDALVVLDQVSEPDCGVVTDLLRSVVAELAGATPQKFVLADSRERIGLFRNVSLKPNERECRQACQVAADVPLESCILKLAHQCGRAVFCTRSEQGVILAEPADAQIQLHAIPAFAVTGPIDPVGAGDSCSAGIVCAMLAGATYAQAAAFGNLVASITIQQLGVTGTASPSQVRQRWQTVRSALPTSLE